MGDGGLLTLRRVGNYLGWVYCNEIGVDVKALVAKCSNGGPSVGGTILYGDSGMSVWVHKSA